MIKGVTRRGAADKQRAGAAERSLMQIALLQGGSLDARQGARFLRTTDVMNGPGALPYLSPLVFNRQIFLPHHTSEKMKRSACLPANCQRCTPALSCEISAARELHDKCVPRECWEEENASRGKLRANNVPEIFLQCVFLVKDLSSWMSSKELEVKTSL